MTAPADQGAFAAAFERWTEPVVNFSDLLWVGNWNGEQVIPLPPLVILLLGAGLYMMIGLRAYPLRNLFSAFRSLFAKSDKQGEGEISPFAALSTALSGQVGTGNLAGVATAIAWGGPGAVFWMWVTALIGMALAFGEGALAIRYRERAPDGTLRGGPMSYITLGLGPKWKWLAVLFCIGTLISALVTGNGIQSNSIADSMNEIFGIDAWTAGIITAIAVFVVIVGGIKSIGNVAEKVVPLMAGLYIVMALLAIILDIQAIPETFSRIFAGAFSAQAAEGGFLGAAMIIAIQFGVARGLFSNEAGQGSTPIAHAVAQTNDPAAQGRFAMLGTFIDTIIICTMTALVILTVQGDFTAAGVAVDHAWQSDLGNRDVAGFSTTSAAFGAAFPMTVAGVAIGTLIASIALILFVFTTLLTWSYYGERAITWLYDQFTDETAKSERVLHMIWRVLWCLIIVVAAGAPTDFIWRLGDIANATMLVPNAIAVLLLSGVVFALARGDRTAGKDYGRATPSELEDDVAGTPGGH